MTLFSYGQWWRKLEYFEGDWDEKFWVKRVTPSKSHLFWHICLLPMKTVATFLNFSFLFFIFFSSFLPHKIFDILGGTSFSLKMLGGHVPPVPPPRLPPVDGLLNRHYLRNDNWRKILSLFVRSCCKSYMFYVIIHPSMKHVMLSNASIQRHCYYQRLSSSFVEFLWVKNVTTTFHSAEATPISNIM